MKYSSRAVFRILLGSLFLVDLVFSSLLFCGDIVKVFLGICFTFLLFMLYSLLYFCWIVVYTTIFYHVYSSPKWCLIVISRLSIRWLRYFISSCRSSIVYFWVHWSCVLHMVFCLWCQVHCLV